MKKLFYGVLLLIIAFLFQNRVDANWLPLSTPCTKFNATTFNSGTLIVPKLEGIFTLCIKQELLENPYAGGSIVFDGSNYTFTSATGVVVFLGSSEPNQSPQFLGNYLIKSKVYRFDKTRPKSCSSSFGSLYFGLPYSPGPYTDYFGGWTNQNIFGRVLCEDSQPAPYIIDDEGNFIFNIAPYSLASLPSIYLAGQYMTGYSLVTPTLADTSGCIQGFYDTVGVHNTDGSLFTFQDNAGNSRTEFCYYSHLIMKDAYPPRILVHDINGTLLEDITSPGYNTGELLAEDTTSFSVEIRDVPDGGSAASGIKNYKAEVTYLADYKGAPVPPAVVCSIPLTVVPPPPADPTGVYGTDIITNFVIQCNTAPALQKTGRYRIDIIAEDIPGNIRTFQSNILVYPNPQITVTPLGQAPGASVNSDGVALHIFDARLLDKFLNPVYNYPVSGIVYKGTANTFRDEIAKTGDPLTIRDPNSSQTNIDGILSAGVRSVAPGDITNAFEFRVNTWSSVDEFKDNSGTNQATYSFGDFTDKRFYTRPYTGILQLLPNDVVLGYTHSGILNIIPAGFAPGVYSVENFTNSLGTVDTNMTLSYQSIISTTGAFFTPEQIGGNILDFRVTTHPFADYIMNGISIRSYITPNPNDPDTARIISGNTGAVNRIYIIGNKQTIGKEGYVTTRSDIGDMTVVDIRNNIRKNANLSVRLRTPNIATDVSPSIVNGIKYIKGDYTITAAEAVNRTWETLIVVDGNVTFDTDKFNTSEKKTAIIVLKTDFNSSNGNIYIKPNVVYISSLLYADGSIKSVDASGNEFVALDSSRSNVLKNQLVLKGVLFSRNTIGGAVLGVTASGKGGKKYTLPGNMGTDSLEDAVNFDLSFLRSGNEGHDNPLATLPYNFGNNAFVVVIYDSNYMISKPAGFNMYP